MSRPEMAWWLAWGTLALVALIVLGLLGLRWLHWRDAPRQAAFQARWRPLLMGCLMGEALPSPLPTLAPRERRPFLQLWLRCQLSVQGPARQHLAQLGQAMGCQTMARGELASKHYAERMQGLLALGFLQDSTSVPLLLQRLADGSNHTVIFTSRALLEISAHAHADTVVRSLLSTPALDFSLVSVLLKPFRQRLGQAMLAAAPRHPSHDREATLHWLRLARALQVQVPHPVLSPLLAGSQHTDTLIAAIRLSQGEGGTDAVCAHAQHADWRVRAQVARALGFMGSVRELPLLVSLTCDAQWWVRHRAAQSLLRLPQTAGAQVMALVTATQDRYAIEMVRAEMAKAGRT